MKARGVWGALRTAWCIFRGHEVELWVKARGGVWTTGFATFECTPCDKVTWVVWTEAPDAKLD